MKMAKSTDWKVGDVLQSKRDPEVQREIVDVRPTGYSWKYPDLGETTPSGVENYWISENSSDPFFEVGWTKISWPKPFGTRGVEE